MTQNIAHFFNLGYSFFQVVLRERLAPVLLVEGPVLLICVSLLRGSQCNNMESVSQLKWGVMLQFWKHAHRCHLDGLAYFHFHSEGRHVGVLSTSHDHLLQRVPFIVTAHRTLLLQGLSNMFFVQCTLGLCSCCARSALEGPLRPSSHRPAELRTETTQYL